jgi:hypothetical protein
MGPRLTAWFGHAVLSRRWLTFVVMGAAFFVFGSGSLNLFFLFKANTELLANHGWQAVMDGGLQQLIELLITGYVSMAAYLVFKVCEHALVHHLATPSEVPPTTESRHEDRSTAR